MAVLNSLRQTPGSLARNPVVFVPIIALLVLQVPQYVLQSVSPALSIVLSLGLSLVFLVAIPFFQGGIVAMADEALDGRTSLNTFVDAGKSNYLSMLVAYLALMALNFVVGMIGFFVAIFGGVFFFQSEGAAVSLPVLAAVGVAVAVVVLAYLLFLFFFQFYGQAIVIDGFGAVDGLRHSASVVRGHVASTLGYTVLVAVLGGVAGLVFGVASALSSAGSMPALSSTDSMSTVGVADPSLGVGVAMALLIVVFGTLFGGFFGVYSVAFYRSINE